MSTRGIVLLAVGVLLVGLLLGALSGGVAGFFIGQNSRLAISRNIPPSAQPQPAQPMPFSVPRGFPPTQNMLNGARVTEVEKDSPAAKAGLQAGDVITAVGGTQIDLSHSLADLIQAHKPGDKVDLAVTRGAQTLTLTVELGASPQNSSTAYLGVRFAPDLGQPLFPGGRRFQSPGSNLPNG